MRVAIGIFAHNESDGIGMTIRSLASQSVFKNPTFKIEVVCLANGCTDDTANVAKHAFGESELATLQHVRVRVCQIDVASKANAWNEFVHRECSEADVLIFCDGDIEFGTGESLARLLEPLLAQEQGVVVTAGNAVRRRAGQGAESVALEGCAEPEESRRTDICGMLYAGWGERFRQIWLPPHLLVEDGFVRAMIVTRNFTTEDHPQSVSLVPGATVLYEPYTGVGANLKHRRRLIAGSTVNAILFSKLWELGKSKTEVGTWIETQNNTDPKWVERLVRKELDKRWWIIPSELITSRFRRISGNPGLKRRIFAMLGTGFELCSATLANSDLRKGRYRW